MNKARSILGSFLLIATFSVGFKLSAPTGLTTPVNMYLADSLLFVSDQTSGIHVYSIKNQTHPLEKMVIPLVNNSGLAIKGNIVYANSNDAILAIRVHDDSLYEVVKVINNVGYTTGYFEGADIRYSSLSCGCLQQPTVVSGGGAETSNPNMAGSMAIFAVIDSFLYYIDKSNIVTLDISKPDDPKELSRTYIDWAVETLFPTQNYLFIGGTMGMYVLDRKDPKNPLKIGSLQHFKSCDPVVVKDSIAYVTLRSGNRCGDNHDELMVVNIANPANPFIVSETAVSTPYGLALHDSLLYIAQAANGYTLCNVSDPKNPTLSKQWNVPDARDFIWYKNTVYIMGLTNVMIYNAQDPNNPQKLSTIE